MSHRAVEILLVEDNAAEARLTESALPALTTERINGHGARCMLTVNPSGDGLPAVLAFEAWLGSTIPRIRWVGRDGVHTLPGFDRSGVERIVNDFVDCALQETAREPKSLRPDHPPAMMWP